MEQISQISLLSRKPIPNKSGFFSTLLAERHHATIAKAIVSIGFTPVGRQLTATSIATTNRPLKSEGR